MDYEQQQPDGTYFIRDKNGKMQKGWIPPELFDNIVMNGGAQRKYRILIKGPWTEIKQMFLQLTDEQIAEYLDESKQGYAFGSYKEDVFYYQFVNKQIWDKFEDVEKIFFSDSLSEENKLEKMNKIIRENYKP